MVTQFDEMFCVYSKLFYYRKQCFGFLRILKFIGGVEAAFLSIV